jgi:hypothetical protein
VDVTGLVIYFGVAALIIREPKMTLIAQLSINGAPFLIGDVLLSSEKRTGLKVNLPLVGNINEVLASNGQPFEVSFSQKVNILSGRLAVAWSGSMLEAERALGALSRLSSRSNLNLDEIGRELIAIQEQLAHLQLVGVLLGDAQGPTRTADLLKLGVPGVNVLNIGPVFAAGTGQDFFLNLLGKSNWTNSGTGNEFQVAHALLGALTNEEYRTGSSILNRWGGGFEGVICSTRTGQFEKVGDVLHTFWTMREHEDDSLALLPMFYKTTYWRDALLIRYARLEEVSADACHLVSNDLTLIPPLLKQVADYNLSEFGTADFSYRAICCHVLVEKSDNRDVLFFIEQRKSEPDFEVEVSESYVRLCISSRLTDAIIHEAHTRD